MSVRLARQFWRDEGGLEVVEYAVILGMIVAASITVLSVLGFWVAGTFKSAVPGGP
jgi:Flp pilus assembly pilin Flp